MKGTPKSVIPWVYCHTVQSSVTRWQQLLMRVPSCDLAWLYSTHGTWACVPRTWQAIYIYLWVLPLKANPVLMKHVWSIYIYIYIYFTVTFNRFTSKYIYIYIYICVCVYTKWMPWLVNTFRDVRFEVFTAVIMKNVVCWDIEAHFVLHRRHITSPLLSPAS
jgi:hypothetical protein